MIHISYKYVINFDILFSGENKDKDTEVEVNQGTDDVQGNASQIEFWVLF